VYVAEDHPLYREGLTSAIAERGALELVGAGGDGPSAVTDILRLRPDVAVLDQRMPGLTGTEVLQRVRAAGLDTHVVFLSAVVDSSLVYQAMAGGGDAYLSKKTDPGVICDAVLAVARGEAVLSPDVHTGLVDEIRTREQRPGAVLTPRERAVLRLVAAGHSAPVVGERLELSPATVRTHLRSIYEKLGVSGRASAVAEAMRRGVLE
jgi:two-component system nitrate/nitrite response regulator NarL